MPAFVMNQKLYAVKALQQYMETTTVLGMEKHLEYKNAHCPGAFQFIIMHYMG